MERRAASTPATRWAALTSTTIRTVRSVAAPTVSIRNLPTAALWFPAVRVSRSAISIVGSVAQLPMATACRTLTAAAAGSAVPALLAASMSGAALSKIAGVEPRGTVSSRRCSKERGRRQEIARSSRRELRRKRRVRGALLTSPRKRVRCPRACHFLTPPPLHLHPPLVRCVEGRTDLEGWLRC